MAAYGKPRRRLITFPQSVAVPTFEWEYTPPGVGTATHNGGRVYYPAGTTVVNGVEVDNSEIARQILAPHSPEGE